MTAATESLQVQTLRGLACLFLVAFHVIGALATTGMHVGDGSLYRDFADLLAHVRMPLFAFLSGFVYAYRPVVRGTAGAFARKKLVRLWLPMVTVSTVYFSLALFAPEANWQMPLEDLWTIYFFPYVHFWFLQAMILIFAAVVGLEKLGLLADARRFGVILAVAAALSLFSRMSLDSFFSIQQAIHLLPFFLLGLGANRFRAVVLQPAVMWACAATFLIAMTMYAQAVLSPTGEMAERGTVLSIAIGSSGTLALLYWFPHVRLLERIGKYSFCIYLYHPFFTGASRALVHLMQVTSNEIEFVAGLTAGILGPILIEHAVVHIPIARPWLLGQSGLNRRTVPSAA